MGLSLSFYLGLLRFVQALLRLYYVALRLLRAAGGRNLNWAKKIFCPTYGGNGQQDFCWCLHLGK